jgi:hypothetical protein
MIFEAAQKFESLQTIDPQLLKKIVIGEQRSGRHSEVFCSEIENLSFPLV